MSTEAVTTPPRRDLSALRIPRDEMPEPRRRGIPAWLVVLVLLVGAAAAGWVLLSRSEMMAPEVTTAAVTLDRPTSGAEAVQQATGYVVARTKASVSAKVAGRLEAMYVQEADQVKAGDVIARIEHADLDAALAASRAVALEARARLRSAQAVRHQANQERARQQRLLEQGVGTAQAHEGAEAAARTAEAEEAAAAAAIQTAESQARMAEVLLENSNVRAPFDGTILRKEADVGESVAPAIGAGSSSRGSIVTMADLSKLDVEVDVSEANVARIAPDQPAEISLDAIPDRRYRGRVRMILPTADRQKATVPIKVALEDADQRVKPEMSARVSFLSGELDEKVLQAPPETTAPQSAIVVEGTAAHAWVVAEGKVRKRTVEVGDKRGDRIVIRSGLDAGQMVVTNPMALKDEMKVKVKS